MLRIGIDLGGTKISAIMLDKDGKILKKARISSPRGNYNQTITTITELVRDLEKDIPAQASVGIGVPGSVSPATGNLQNANSVWLNGKPFKQDLTQSLSRDVRLANDANCFALSEAIDGAGAGYGNVFGVILGTGCGGGLVIDRKLVDGPRGIAGEWGHNPLPWPKAGEINVTQCWCGQSGCIETWISGPGFAEDHFRITGERLTAEEIVTYANDGELSAQASLDRLVSRLARGLAVCVNMFDPDIIVLGGGLSNIPYLYKATPEKMAPYIFCDHKNIHIQPPTHGDDSGVRGAAWLWG